VDYVAGMDIMKRASKLSSPEANSRFCERTTTEMEAQVTSGHEVDNDVQVVKVLKRVAKVADEGMP
jgi:predicted transglutaminase-like cysteine proteinase